MKKLFNSRFLIILASSIVVLILLTIGAFYLFDDKDDVFVSSGYILNPLSSTSEKFFFEENTGYKENLSSMVEFIDVDENTVSVLKDSFLHYDDESISFLKKGAILDLDTIKDSKVVSFYNITKKSVIKKEESGYIIESASGDIRLKNFIGRISDNKYIVVGKLSLKIAGNDTTIDGDYFEVVYIEEGIVNIENKDVKYQVAADDTYIYVGDKVIDLGNKKITMGDKDIMSITAITIDGNENIEIIPKGNEEDNDTEDNDSVKNDNDDELPNEPERPEETLPPAEEGDGSGEDGSGTGDGNKKPVKPEISVTLKNAKTGSTNIDVVFDIINATEEDMFKLQVVNLDSGRTVDIDAQVVADSLIKVNLLTPNTKYLFTVVNKKDNGKYFQKVLETSSFGIKLEKKYATSDSLVYNVTIDEGTDITNAKLSLYKFNEKTMKNEIVVTEYKAPGSETVETEDQIVILSKLKGGLEGEHEIVFDNLDSDTIYTAVLDEFSVASTNFNDIYNITLTSMTLKKTPDFIGMVIEKNKEGNNFRLSPSKIVDDDNAIVSYTYLIYEQMNDSKPAIKPIVSSNASPITVSVNGGIDELKSDTNYYYNVIVEYFDNEKYIEYVTSDSIIFNMGNEPIVEVSPIEEWITHETLGARIKLIDTSCLISQPGRNCGMGESLVLVEVREVLTNGDLANEPVYSKNIVFDFSEEPIKYDLYVGDDIKLEPGKTYNISVIATYNPSDGLDPVTLLHTEDSVQNIRIKSLASFRINWPYKQGNTENVIQTGAQFLDNETFSALSSEESLSLINKVNIKLYQGRYTGGDVEELEFMKTVTISTNNAKKDFYDNVYELFSYNTFGYTMEQLKNRNNGELSQWYTLVLDAYTAEGYQIDFGKTNIYPYAVSSTLFMDEVTKPTFEVSAIGNSASEYKFDYLSNGGTIVGYQIMTAFDKSEFEEQRSTAERINYYVYNKNKEKVKFYILNEDGKLELTNKYTLELDENVEFSLDAPIKQNIYLDYGIEYELTDNIMRRGNDYYVGCEIEVLSDGQISLFPEADGDAPTEFGMYKQVTVQKEIANIKMYVSRSDKESITYKYMIDDPDKTLYKNTSEDSYSLYYKVGVDGAERKHALVSVSDSKYNKYDGQFTISGLSSGSVYGMHFLVNQYKFGEYDADIIKYFENQSGTVYRMFDGYYDPNNSSYNLSYKIINDPSKDNRVAIRINASETILHRVLAYKLEFYTADGETLPHDEWKLSACPDDKATDVPRCIYVDYTDLKKAGMQGKDISVSVQALYDNGLIGFDFKVGSNIGDEYPYCIMQQNSNAESFGTYVVTNDNKSFGTWTRSNTLPGGFYEYEMNEKWLQIDLYGKHLSNVDNEYVSIRYYMNANGVVTLDKNYSLNPKMITVKDMSLSGSEETFAFYSIIPKIRVTNAASLLDGHYLNLKPSGVSISDIEKEGGKYYFYVGVWDNNTTALNDTNFENVVRPVVKVQIKNTRNPNTELQTIVDGLMHSESNKPKTYYYRVFAKLRNDVDEFKMTPLYDASSSNTVKTYPYQTLTVADVFSTSKTAKDPEIKLSYSIPEDDLENLLPENYNNKDLDVRLKFKPYGANMPYNFGITYVLCEQDSEVCDLDNNIFEIDISEAEMASLKADARNIKILMDNLSLSEKLPDDYNFEFNKNYTMYVYATFDNYYKTPTEIGERSVRLNPANNSTFLDKVTEPSFFVTRTASIDAEGKYYIDFDVTLNDVSRTLINGNYYVSLKKDGNLTGTLMVQGDDGVFVPIDVEDYSTYALSGYKTSRMIRIYDLEPDTRYLFEVYGTAKLNNADVPIENREVYINKPYTVYSAMDLGVAFGHDLGFSAAERSVVITFYGGSSFDKVRQVRYTISKTEGDNMVVMPNGDGTYNLDTDPKTFDKFDDKEDIGFTINPAGLLFQERQSQYIVLRFCIGESADNCIWYPDPGVHPEEIVKRFEGKFSYVKDE